MKDFFKSFFASLIALGVFSAVMFILFIGFIAAAGASKQITVPSKAVLVFDLDLNIPDTLRDDDPSQAFQQAFGQGKALLALPTAIEALDRASKDDRIAGLFLTGNLRPDGYGAGPAALRELKAALARFKARKPVIAYNMGWAKRDYYLASGVSKLYLHPFGAMEVNGLAAEPMFFGEAFKKYGIEVQVTRVGKYKSAVEPFILDKMSSENREQTQKLLDDIWGEWKDSVAADRRITPAALQDLADTKGLLSGEEAMQAGLVDALKPYDEVLDELKKLAGKGPKDRDFPQMDLSTYAAVPDTALKGSNRIAVVFAEGEIVDGEGRDAQIGGDSMARELRRLRLDDKVKAIVLRVNSPGGSAAASEVIQREVILARKVKPVVVSMGTVAASGGYWISTYADRIFAEPNTITGSIGVFGLLPNVQKLANEHGLTFDRVETAKLANPFSLVRPKSEVELARIQSQVDRIYDQFLMKVADSRHKAKDAVHEIAQGRVWSGSEALKLGLVDELGGLQDAIRDAARRAKIEGDYRLLEGGPRKTPIQRLLESMGGGEPRKLAKQGPVGTLLGEAQHQLLLLESLNDPQGVYARMPIDLVVK
ncbi:MAG TPA: signal peptide peptidase SppA [Holophagaceae bacterium]|nr:signal peptide peptidase SppA [Holophagaceae bacterium]